MTSSAWISGESSSPNAAWMPALSLRGVARLQRRLRREGDTRSRAFGRDGCREAGSTAADHEHVEGGAWAHGRMLAQILIPVITDRYRMTDRIRHEGYTPPLMGTLGEIVKPTFITVAPEDTLGEVAERMSAQNVGAVVVKDFGRLIGVLTERDMLRAMAARVHTSDARVRQWMTENPITASPGHHVRRGVKDHARQGLPAPARRRRRHDPRDREPAPDHGRPATDAADAERTKPLRAG